MNRIIKNTATLTIAAAMAIGIFFTAATNAQSKDESKQSAQVNPWICGNQMIRGKYSYTASGSVLPDSPLPVPPGLFSSIGSVSLDGRGNITEHITNDNFNGLILPAINYTGTYSVNSDCSGTAELVGRAPYKFTIAGGGSEIYFMLDAPNTVITGVAKRQ